MIQLVMNNDKSGMLIAKDLDVNDKNFVQLKIRYKKANNTILKIEELLKNLFKRNLIRK